MHQSSSPSRRTSYSRRIAFRYLVSRRGEAFISIITVISVLGVAIGVTVLNAVMAVMTGFQFELREKILGTNSHIVIRNSVGVIRNWNRVQDSLSAQPNINTVSPFVMQQALLRSADRSTGIFIKGVAPHSASAEQLHSYLPKSSPSELFRSRDPNAEDAMVPGIILGRELALSLGALEGSIVTVLSPQVNSSPFGLIPNFRRFVVRAVYSSGLSEYEEQIAYVEMEEAQKFFRLGDGVSGFEVRVKNLDDSPVVARQLLTSLGGLRSGFTVQDWSETNKPFWNALALEKRIYFIVLLLIVVMASFSIISTLVMMVLEKRKDIAVLRTLGASAAGIRRIFTWQGAIIGASGTILGLLGGYLFCIGLRAYGWPLDVKVFPVSTVPVKIEFVNFAAVGVCSFLICLLATIYPARRASKLHPTEILRYE